MSAVSQEGSQAVRPLSAAVDTERVYQCSMTDAMRGCVFSGSSGQKEVGGVVWMVVLSEVL